MNTARSKEGAVLLETLLVMPVYLVLIGGIMWIGDLILAKQQCVIADRYGAWNLGNMHRGSDSGFGDEIQDNFFPAAMHPHQTSRLLPPAPRKWAVRWWDTAFATVFLKMKMPEWTKGWLASASQVHLGEHVRQILGVQGRDVPGLKHHLVIMRTWRSKEADYPRNWEPKKLAGLGPGGPWKRLVYREPWPMHMRILLFPFAAAGEEYTRYGPYVAVSL